MLEAKLLAAVLVVVTKAAWAVITIDSKDTCFDVIKKVANFDRQLGVRNLVKGHVLQAAKETKTDMATAVCEFNKLKQDCAMSRCCSTADYICDTFCPLETLDARKTYSNMAGDIIHKMFDDYSKGDDNKKKHLMYGLEQVGVHFSSGHEFTVEQVPDPKGIADPQFRVYQSYMGGYSLHAWLSDTVQSAGYNEATNNGDIVLNWLTWCGIKKTTFLEDPCGPVKGPGNRGHYDAFKEKMTTEMKKATEPATKKALEDYKKVIDEASQAKAVDSFKKAWEVFGKGKLLPKAEFMAKFVAPLVTIAKWFNANTGDKAMDKTAFEEHEKIFGAKMTAYFPGVPMNFFPTHGAQRTYDFNVHVIDIKDYKGKTPDQLCRENGQILLNSVQAK